MPLLYILTKSSFYFCGNVYPVGVGVEAWNWNSRSSIMMMMMMMSTSMAAASSLGGIISSASSSSRTSIQCSGERQALFNRIAPVYDGLNDVLSLGQHRLWKRMSVTWSGAKKGDSVLDLCCGSGDLTFLLSHHVGLHGQVSALDFSSDQLSIASSRQELNWKACYDNIKWIEGDALDLPFSSSSFDAITMGYGLRNLVDRKKAMQEIFRVLKPGSRASILDFNKSTSAIAAMFRVWMMDNVVVPVASTYGLADEYRYLRDSINDFLTGKELEELARGVGFNKAKHYELGGGLMGNLVVTK